MHDIQHDSSKDQDSLGPLLEIYEFGPFRLERAERKLFRGSEIVALTPKAFDALCLLVRNSGHLIEKEDLIRMLWPDTFVEEGSLSNNIFLLRKVLGQRCCLHRNDSQVVTGSSAPFGSCQNQCPGVGREGCRN
jgi:DNA-binding response OmpR family regulator